MLDCELHEYVSNNVLTLSGESLNSVLTVVFHHVRSQKQAVENWDAFGFFGIVLTCIVKTVLNF